MTHQSHQRRADDDATPDDDHDEVAPALVPGRAAAVTVPSDQETADRGVSGSGGALPFHERIQAAFGRHDVSAIRAHADAPAVDAARDLGARAYATGNNVAFARTPDLHTVAHEAAHVVQQRAGVALKGGRGEAGDPYERHADAVADLVVQGRSAEALLDQHAGGSSGGGGGHAAVQLLNDEEEADLKQYISDQI